MSSTYESGTMVYEGILDITGATDFGISLEAVVGGEPIPPEGVRIDVHVEGPLKGGLLNGHITATDYLYGRPDGRLSLYIRGVITTNDDARISFLADGVATPQADSPNMDLRENVTLHTSDPRYTWVNGLQIWGSGVADNLNQKITIKTWVA
ncbi:MAG: hypothetical protein ACI89D_001380 [Bermanella sp.]|jgi:hypothetical protein